MLGDLTGKTALVTGAGSGIGRGIAMMLAEQGPSVAITDVISERATEVAAEMSDARTMTIPLDVTDQESADKAVRSVISEWGALDILINNAGVSSAPNRQQGEEREEDWDVTFAINVKGVMHCCNAAIPHMRDRHYGKIVNIGSQASHSPRRSGGSYAVSKAAVLRYTKGLAETLAPHNINVNAILSRGGLDAFPGGRCIV